VYVKLVLNLAVIICGTTTKLSVSVCSIRCKKSLPVFHDFEVSAVTKKYGTDVTKCQIFNNDVLSVL